MTNGPGSATSGAPKTTDTSATEDDFGTRFDKMSAEVASYGERQTGLESRRLELRQRVSDIQDQMKKPFSFFHKKKLKSDMQQVDAMAKSLSEEAGATMDLSKLDADIKAMAAEFEAKMKSADATGEMDGTKGEDADAVESAQTEVSQNSPDQERLAQLEQDRSKMNRDTKEYAEISREIARMKSDT